MRCRHDDMIGHALYFCAFNGDDTIMLAVQNPRGEGVDGQVARDDAKGVGDITVYMRIMRCHLLACGAENRFENRGKHFGF